MDALLTQYPLSKLWKKTELFSEETVIEDLRIQLSGITAFGENGKMVTGAAAELGQNPMRRSFFEIVERTSIVEAMEKSKSVYELRDCHRDIKGKVSHQDLFPESPQPERWNYAKSNGVAVHQEWKKACNSALLELVERNAMLGSWYGLSKPKPMSNTEPALPGSLNKYYRLYFYSFDSRDTCEKGISVVGIFGFPKSKDIPRVYGAGAGISPEQALSHAGREFLQGLGFLWGETIPLKTPEFSPTPDYHQELFLYPPNHRYVESWLREGHGKKYLASGAKAPEEWLALDVGEVGFVDITPEQLQSRLHVVKAVSKTSIPLFFGCGLKWIEKDFPAELQIHPFS